jgi:hypothetical protein
MIMILLLSLIMLESGMRSGSTTENKTFKLPTYEEAMEKGDTVVVRDLPPSYSTTEIR